MLNAGWGGWVRRLKPGTRRLMVFGDSDAARNIARGAAGAGFRVSSHEVNFLRSGAGTEADGLILDCGDEAKTLDEARGAAARLSGVTIGVVVESWSAFTAALTLDAEFAAVRVRPLCVSERTARAALIDHPWWRLRRPGKASTAIIFGTGTLTEHLVIGLFRNMHLAQQAPQLAVVGTDAPQWVAVLHRTLPQLQEIGSLVGVTDAAGVENPCIVFATRNHPDLACFSPAVPLVWLAQGEAPARARRAASLDWQAMAQSLFADPRDTRAEAIHSFYLEAALRDGDTPGSRPSMQPWAQLPERYRQASRYQADHVPATLAMIGSREVASPARWRFRFAPGEVDALARVEHARWSAVQLLDGWRYRAVRDDKARLTPFLKPYDELAPEIQERDRMPIRQIQAQLARVGHSVKRDLVVVLSADADSEEGFAFPFLFRRLLADIAARYPDRQLVLASRLMQRIERRAAAIALARRLPLRVLLPAGLAVPAEAEALLTRADQLLVEGDAAGDLHIHIGDKAPVARRLVVMDRGGSLRSAPWF